MISDGGETICREDDYAWILPHAGTTRTKATRCQVLSAVGPADLQDDVRGKDDCFSRRGDPGTSPG